MEIKILDNANKFQDHDWYEQYNNNFTSSPLFTQIKSVELFHAGDMVRFGTFKKRQSGEYMLYYVKIPKNMNVYHGSRSLALNHSSFPIRSWDNNVSVDENQNTESLNFHRQCNNGNYNDCRPLTYYSSVPQSEYAISAKPPFENAVNFSYGVSGMNSDRSNYISNNTQESSDPNRRVDGFISYKTKTDGNFVLMMDPFLSKLGVIVTVSNVRIITQDSILSLSDEEKAATGISLASNIRTMREWLGFKGTAEQGIDWMADHIRGLIKFGTNTSSLKDIIQNSGGLGFIIDAVMQKYNGDFGDKLNILLKDLALSPTDSIPGYTNSFLENIYGIPHSIIPGFRTSTFEFDRPIHTKMRNFVEANKDFYGFIGGNMYSPRFLGNDTTGYNENLQFSQLVTIAGRIYPISERNMFHTEMGCNYAPNILAINTDNDYSENRLLNDLGILTEFRKYKTSNRLKNTSAGSKGFHQGHLYEHSTWVALNGVNYSAHVPKVKKLIAMTGILHDIGKSGDCHYNKMDWEKFDPHNIPKHSWCSGVGGNVDEYGFMYNANPDHPEEGWRILRGLKPYSLFKFSVLTGTTLKVETQKQLTQVDFDKFLLKFLDGDLIHVKILRIVVACHWHLGPLISEWVSEPDAMKKMTIIKKYLRQIELFANAERLNLKDDPTTFVLLVDILIIISVADIAGALYDPNLQTYKDFKITNELPNYEIFEELLREVVEQSQNNFNYDKGVLESEYTTNEGFKKAVDEKINKMDSEGIKELYQKAANRHAKSSMPKNIYNNMIPHIEDFKRALIKVYNTQFTPNPSNNFIILDNLINAFDTVDIFKAYSYKPKGSKDYILGNYLPKVIAFDLDGTLLNQEDNTHIDGKIKYGFVKDITKIIGICQKLRKYGVKIAIASRHYIPLQLLDELNKDSSPIYHKNFDIIISQYTGDLNVIEAFCANHNNKKICKILTDACTQESSTVYENRTCLSGKYGVRKLPNSNVFVNGEYDSTNDLFKSKPGQAEGTKIYHINEIIKHANCKRDEVILFDDGEHYIRHPEEYLGGKVFTAGVMPSGDMFGVQLNLLHKAIAIYVFDKMREI